MARGQGAHRDLGRVAHAALVAARSAHRRRRGHLVSAASGAAGAACVHHVGDVRDHAARATAARRADGPGLPLQPRLLLDGVGRCALPRRGRRHLAVADPAHRVHHADRHVRVVRLDHHPHEGMVLRASRPAGRDDRRLRRARSLPVLRVLGADAGTDVPDDRHLGRRGAHPRHGEVLPLHDVWLDADARGHSVPRVHVWRDHRQAVVRLLRSAARHDPAARADLALGRILALVPHQSADVPAAHVAAGRTHRGPDCRLDHSGRGHAQDGHLRLPSLLDGAVSRGVGAVRRHARRHRRRWRYLVRRALRLEARRHQETRRVLVRRAPRLRHARPLLGHAVRHRRRRAADGQPRHHHRPAVSPGRRHLRPSPHPSRR